MRSKSRATRENQKKFYDQRIQERRAELEKKGLTSKDFNKDKVYEHLKAKQRDIMRAMVVIEAIEKRNEPREEAAAAPEVPVPEAPKEKKPKKEKSEKAKKAAPAKAGD
jgi:hypothetical protein